MEVGIKVIQSSSVIKGAYWARVIEPSPNLILIKHRIIEAYQINEEDGSIYCIFEQSLGFDIEHSGVSYQEARDLLLVSTGCSLKFLDFAQDHFEPQFLINLPSEISQFNTDSNLIAISTTFKQLHLYNLHSRQEIYKYDSSLSIIDFHFLPDCLLILESSPDSSFCVTKLCTSYLEVINNQKLLMLPDCPINLVYFNQRIFIFSCRSALMMDSEKLESGNLRGLEGTFSSSAIVNNNLYCIMDNGDLLKAVDNVTFVGKVDLLDCVIVGLESMICAVSACGKLRLIDFDAKTVSEISRNGPIIDAFMAKLSSDIDFDWVIAATVSRDYSEIVALSDSINVDIVARCKNIAKYSINAMFIDEHVVLIPDLKVINIKTFKVVNASSIGLIDEKTIYLCNTEIGLIQITETQLLNRGQEVYKFEHHAISAHISYPSICIGLISQCVLFFKATSLLFRIDSIDFSSLFLDTHLYIGLQQSGYKKFNLSGAEIATIPTSSIPHSFSSKWGFLFIGTRDGQLIVQNGSDYSTNSIKLGQKPLEVNACTQGLTVVSDKSYLFFNKHLDFKLINIQDAKFIVQSDLLIAVSNDVTFFNFEEKMNFNLKQVSLKKVQGTIKRIVKVSNRLMFYAFEHEGVWAMIGFDLEGLVEVAANSCCSVTVLAYWKTFNCLVTGGSVGNEGYLSFYDLALKLITNYEFQFEVTAVAFSDNLLIVASTYLLYILSVEDLTKPSIISLQKFHSRINDLNFRDNFICAAFEDFGIIGIAIEENKASIIMEPGKRVSVKKMLVNGECIFGITGHGALLIRNFKESWEKVFKCSVGGRVLIEGGISKNLRGAKDQRLVLCGINGEIAEVLVQCSDGTIEVYKEIAKYLRRIGLFDKEIAEPYDLSLLGYYRKLPEELRSDLSMKYPDIEILLEI